MHVISDMKLDVDATEITLETSYRFGINIIPYPGPEKNAHVIITYLAGQPAARVSMP